MTVTESIVTAFGLIVAAPTALAALYLFVLTLLSRKPAPPSAAGSHVRFDVLVPAHNEATGIGRTVSNLQTLDWPRDQFRLMVIADNCTDKTAQLAAEAGATVWERTDAGRRGKGYALAWAFNRCIAERRASAIVVIDADSVVSRNLLAAFATRLSGGAVAAQCHYGVLNPLESWRTRLMTIALSCFHAVRSRARERLNLSCGIRGNGWCIATSLLERMPFESYSLAEDVEYGIDLALRLNTRVAYVDEAEVLGEMVSSAAAAGRQRQRWEGGRLALIGSRLPSLLRKAVLGPSAMCLDLALDLVVPPLSYIVLGAVFGLVLGAVGRSVYGGQTTTLTLSLFAGSAIAAYVVRGWAISGVGWRALADLLKIPGFILHKTLVMTAGRRVTEWIRTDRE
jgi:1,2-diacylglycerol 3-beta-glucosyltransferase